MPCNIDLSGVRFTSTQSMWANVFFCSDGLLGRVETEKGCAAIVREQPSDL